MKTGTDQMLKRLEENYGVSLMEAENLLDDAMYDYDVITAILTCIAKSVEGD